MEKSNFQTMIFSIIFVTFIVEIHYDDYLLKEMLGQGVEHSFIRKTLKHPQSEVLTAFCTLK